MEDISTTSAAYDKDELAIMARHVVVMMAVTSMLERNKEIQAMTIDPDKSKNDIAEDIRITFEQMTRSWSILGPCRALARKLYPQHEKFFDVLDKSLSVHNALDDLLVGRSFGLDQNCNLDCCRRVL